MSYKQLKGDEGVTITWQHRETGETHTAVTPARQRQRTEALREALVEYDAAEWRIRCISTPQTIYDDLIARRGLVERGTDWGTQDPSDAFDTAMRAPERGLLGKVGGVAYL